MIIQAKYALTSPGVVRQDVRLEIDGPRLLTLASGRVPGALQPDHDFGMAVITPGLVNPHTHLELEFCAGQVPYHGSFIAWLQHIRDLKLNRNNQLSAKPIASLRQLAAAGCTTVADHHASTLDWYSIAASGLNYFALREVFGFNNHTPDRQRLASQSRYSFAPHSPYTASLETIQACRELADELNRPLSIHLSEFQREVQFIMTGHDEDIEELHAKAGTADPTWRGTAHSPIRYLGDAGILTPRTLAIHVNYPLPGDLDILAGLKPTVVFCPYSHRFFKHERHPVEQYLEAGVPVALGTDSLASNTQLSPLHEAALVRADYPRVPAATLFQAITSAGLAPFGLERQRGKLEPGCFADLAVFPLPEDPGASFPALFDALCATRSSALTMANGQMIHCTVPALAAASAAP